ncbi:hypothetical protein FACS1894109_15540 [Spirochaetia bacterium]|nr:hypothetical protein FACS1894109_15540 [Spirochaetia bacterium]
MKALEQMDLNELKVVFRKIYLAYDESEELDCGNGIKDMLHPERVAQRMRMQEIWGFIKKIDPSAPDFNVGGEQRHEMFRV